MNHPSIPAADRAVYAASAALEKSLSALAALRRAIPGTLPIAVAEFHMADTETCLDDLARKLTAALTETNKRLDAIQRAEEAAAVDREAWLVDRDFARWTHTLRPPIAAPANDDALAIEGAV